MNKSDFKNNLFEAFEVPIDDLSFDEKMQLIHKCILQYEKKNEEFRDTSNSRRKWKDEELTIVLSDAPTLENCVKYAKLFRRGVGSIDLIYRWAAASDQRIEEERPDDAFVNQVKRVAKKIGWRV